MQLQQSTRRARSVAPVRTSSALLFAMFLIAFVGVTPASAETTAEVETPLGGFIRPGQTTVLLVTVSADQAVTGTIRVSDEGGDSTTETEIEVPGGSAKTFAVPVSIAPWGGRPIVVVETSDGQTRRPQINLQQVGEIEPVAVMPSLVVPGLAERADLAVDLGQARMIRFDPAHLDHGASALGAASAVVATEADLINLNEVQRNALFSWVSSGGNLYLDGTVDGLAQGVVGDLVTAGRGRFVAEGNGSNGRAWLGAGTIYVVGDALSAGRYDGLIKPRFSQEFFEEGQFVDPGDVLRDLSVDAGFSTRPIGPFVAVLLVYIALVGPILWLFLSRSRREPMLWLAVPALAAIVSLGIWGSGRFFRQGTSGSHVTVIGTSGTSAQSLSDYMISSSGGGFTGIELVDGWSQAPTGFNSWDWRFQEAGFASPVLQGNRIGADVPPSGVVVARAASDDAVTGSWQLDLAVDGADITGTATNLTPYGLEQVAIFSGDQLRFLDSVDSGETVEFELSNVSAPELWDDPVQRRLSNGGGSVASPAALQRWISTNGLKSGTGHITVIGWTTTAPAPLKSIGGRSVDKGRTGFISSFAVGNLDAGSMLSEAAVRSRTVDMRWSEEFGGGGLVAVERRGQFEGEIQTVAYDIPPGQVANEGLIIDVPAQVSAMDIWVGDSWVDAGVGAAESGDLLIRLPDEAVKDGSIFIRALLQPPNDAPTIRSASAEELPQTIKVPGQVSNASSETSNDAEGDG